MVQNLRRGLRAKFKFVSKKLCYCEQYWLNINIIIIITNYEHIVSFSIITILAISFSASFIRKLLLGPTSAFCPREHNPHHLLIATIIGIEVVILYTLAPSGGYHVFKP